MLTKETVIKKRKRLIFLTISFLIIFINTLYFIYKYYPVEESIPEVTQKTFENFLVSDYIDKVDIVTNSPQVFVTLKMESKDYFFKVFENKMRKIGPQFKLQITTQEIFKKDLVEMLAKLNLKEDPRIIEGVKDFPRSYFIKEFYIIEVLIISIGIILNFIPPIIASKKSFFNQIFALNLFLGWTGLGWVIGLIWSLKNE